MEARLLPELGCCGDDCGLCPRYQATLSGNLDRLREVADLWHRVGWRETVAAPEEIACHGCRAAASCRYGIRECARAKKAASCGRCGDYPCARLRETFARTEDYARICRQKCSDEEYEGLRKAFFAKRENLDREKGGT